MRYEHVQVRHHRHFFEQPQSHPYLLLHRRHNCFPHNHRYGLSNMTLQLLKASPNLKVCWHLTHTHLLFLDHLMFLVYLRYQS